MDLIGARRIVLGLPPDPNQWKVRPMRRKVTKQTERRMVAYDLETTKIKKGTPSLLYITAFGENLRVSTPVYSYKDLLKVLLDKFLVPENDKARFVGWNANRFDVSFISQALLLDSRFVVRPYMTTKHTLRGMKVSQGKLTWEFLDGMAMTGIEKSLKEFLKVFAPDYEKLSLDLSKITFDPSNPKHVAYAERDSEGLYHAMTRAQSILKQRFDHCLNPTIGNTGIRIFQANLPKTAECWRPQGKVELALRDYAMRGGFCYCVKKYQGPVWKYDINQAYAAAMRDAFLPSGKASATPIYRPGKCAIYQVSGTHNTNSIPFYIKDEKGNSATAVTELVSTWITSIEYDQLISEGWNLDIEFGYYWPDSFRMEDYVFFLEQARRNAPGGPSGAEGLMIKAIGNNSYGKTVERLGGEEIVAALKQPEGFRPYHQEDIALSFVWSRKQKALQRDYHCPQIGTFITAHVRMVVRRAILEKPSAWLYADTDCVMFSEPVNLDFDTVRYGAWKIEEEGGIYRLIDKKVYHKIGDKKIKHAKGMNVARLGEAAFKRWYEGRPPTQYQLHRQNFLRFLAQPDKMFIIRKRRGELDNGKRGKDQKTAQETLRAA